jgi:hypothetical protein
MMMSPFRSPDDPEYRRHRRAALRIVRQYLEDLASILPPTLSSVEDAEIAED